MFNSKKKKCIHKSFEYNKQKNYFKSFLKQNNNSNNNNNDY